MMVKAEKLVPKSAIILRTWAVLLVGVSLSTGGCHQKHFVYKTKAQRVSLLHAGERKLTDIIVYDIFSPPVASRIYAYCSLAAYEAVRFEKLGNTSITARLKGFRKIAAARNVEEYDFTLAAMKAFCTVGKKMIFSSDLLEDFERPIYQKFKASLPDDVFRNSMAFGDSVAAVILKRAARDHYKETRGLPRYAVVNTPGVWKPTAPDYMDAVEPYFNRLSPLFLDSCAQFKPVPPNPFSLAHASAYYKELMEVYHVRSAMTPVQQTIASFWDCNPYVGHHKGHLMFATKKITPGGHWMGITRLACNKTHADIVRSAAAYAMVSVTLFDAFISCWDEKYRSVTVRPETVIHDALDEDWKPLLQTPPFPEYPSGHSVISSASSVVLSHLFGDKFSYTDSVEVDYDLFPRSFTSFTQAAQEAAISRLYGGIHYRKAIEEGFKEGKSVGEKAVAVLFN